MSLVNEVITSPSEKIVYVTPEVDQAFPHAVEAFNEVDWALKQGPNHNFAYSRDLIDNLSDSCFSFRSSNEAKIHASILPGKGRELLVMWAPFADRNPKTSSETIYRYMSGQGSIDKAIAAPNTWNQLTKSSVVLELLKASGLEMPVLTIFHPFPSFPFNAYTPEENRQIRQGDFTPAGRIARQTIEAAVKHAQDRLHGPVSETQLDEFHFHGASLGASSVIGAAASFTKKVHSVTAQELIVAPKNVLFDLAPRFLFKDPVGEPSKLPAPIGALRIYEPLLRQLIDRNGSEFMTNLRSIHGMTKLSRLKGLTRPERNQTPRLIERLLESEVSVMIPLAEDSGLTYDTPKYLPNAGEQVVKVKATKGERTGHLIDEHVGLTALLAVMNIKNA